MTALKITEEKRKELTDAGVVICTYVDSEGNDFDGISDEYSALYPEFEVVEIQTNNWI
jgi:hypothetical protein